MHVIIVRWRIKPEFVQARHEEMAAFEAVGYAKFSGNVGVCAATSGFPNTRFMSSTKSHACL